MKYACLALVALLAGGSPTAGAQPTFDTLVVPTGQVHCPFGFSGTRSPNNAVLSVLRTAKAAGDKDFLVVGRGSKSRDYSSCTFIVRFEKPFTKLETLYIDLRGTEFKEQRTTFDWTFHVGQQRHRSMAASGGIVDASTDMYKRVAIALPRGATTLRVRLTGNAASTNSSDTAIVAIDAFDMCFFDAEHPEYCGPTAGPREAAKR